VDGTIHFEEGHKEKDGIRQKQLESFGVTVIRFSDLDVKNNLVRVLEEIKGKIEKLKPTPDPSQEGNSKKFKL